MEHEPQRIAHATLVERVGQVRQLLQVRDPVAGGLLPGGLTGEHQIGVVEEEKAHHDGGEERDDQAEEEQEVGLKPLLLTQGDAAPETGHQKNPNNPKNIN